MERSYSGCLDRSVADRSIMNRSHANRLINHFKTPNWSSADNRYDNNSSNISYYIRILETYIIIDIYKLILLYHKGEIIEALELNCTNSKKVLCDFYID